MMTCFCLGTESNYIHKNFAHIVLFSANLSQIYFEQRQDRYVWIKNGGELVNYFTEFIDVLGKLSFECKSSLSSNNSSTTVPVTIFIPPVDAHPVHHSRKFKEKAYNRISEFLDKWSNKNGMQLSELLKQGIIRTSAFFSITESGCRLDSER